MPYNIRPYHPSDLVSLYRICRLTGDGGSDVSHLYDDPELFGHFYAAPYAVFEPDLCFVLTQASTPCGYVLGTRDSIAFRARCEHEWFPPLRRRYPLPDPDDSSANAAMVRLIHEGHEVNHDLLDYPAHLHIDLLPAARGQGWGIKLMERFLAQLRALNVPAVCLEVGKRNTGAIGFYERVGFRRVKEYDGAIAFGMELPTD